MDGIGITTLFATDDDEIYTCGYNFHSGVHMYGTNNISSPVKVDYK